MKFIGLFGLIMILLSLMLGKFGNSDNRSAGKAAVRMEQRTGKNVVESIEPRQQKVSQNYQNALRAAEDHQERMYLSKRGLYEELTSEYADRFKPEAARYAVTHLKHPNWKHNATLQARSYQKMSLLSPDAIREQLTSEYGDKFTKVQADYAVKHLEK